MKRYANALGFLALAAIWGASFPAVEVALEGVEPTLLAAIRFDLAGLLVLGYAVVASDRVLPARRDVPAVLAGGAFIVAGHHALLFAGQQYVTSGVAAVIVAAVPVFSAVIARAVLPENALGVTGAVGLALGLLGVAIIARPTPETVGTDTLLGVALVFVAALSWAIGAVSMESLRSDLPVASQQAWLMLAGAPMLHVASLALGETQRVDATTEVVLALGYLVPVAGGLGYLLFFALLDRLGSVEINLVSYALPVVATLVGWLVLDEPLVPAAAVGFACILAGFALVKRRTIRNALRRDTNPATGD